MICNLEWGFSPWERVGGETCLFSYHPANVSSRLRFFSMFWFTGLDTCLKPHCCCTVSVVSETVMLTAEVYLCVTVYTCVSVSESKEWRWCFLQPYRWLKNIHVWGQWLPDLPPTGSICFATCFCRAESKEWFLHFRAWEEKCKE